MKIKLALVLSLFVLWSLGSRAQLTLDSCINMAYDHFEYELQAEAYRSAADLAEKKTNTNWYPKLVLDGNATYQNENINIPVAAPGVESPNVPLNFNRLLLNFNQSIYDGSVTANKKKLEASKYSLLESQIETDKIRLKSKVISLYMSILLTKDQMEIIISKRSVVVDKLESLKGAEEYGATPMITIRSLQAELLSIDQQIIEIESSLSTLHSSLSEACGTEIVPSTAIERPQPIISLDNNVENRPEIQLLSLQIENYELQKGMVGTSRLPTLNAFGSFGGGLPGYNIFNNEVAFMGLVGLQLKWNIVDYGLAKNEKQILSLNQQISQMQQSRLRTQFISELKAAELEMAKMNRLLESDEEMIALRKEISQMKSAQLDEGVVTASEYLSELNMEEEALLNYKIHELKLILSQLNYLTIQGN